MCKPIFTEWFVMVQPAMFFLHQDAVRRQSELREHEEEHSSPVAQTESVISHSRCVDYLLIGSEHPCCHCGQQPDAELASRHTHL